MKRYRLQSEPPIRFVGSELECLFSDGRFDQNL